MRPRCGKDMPRSTICGRPQSHAGHCISQEAWETMRQRNLRRLAAARLLDQYLSAMTPRP